MPRAVRFDRYGPVDVLYIADVPTPSPGHGEIVVEVIATSINPGEIAIREGAMHERFPARFPSGQGSDLTGRVAAIGDDVTGWTAGQELIGWTDRRNAQAEYVAVPAGQVTAKPARVDWNQAGCLYVAGCTARGMVDLADPQPGQTVVVTAAVGGVGSIVIQLLRRHDVRVLGVAGPVNDDWLTSAGVQPIHHGDGFADRLREATPDGVDAVLDCFGEGYVAQAIELGVPARRVMTIADFAAAKQHGARTVFGHQVASADMLADLAELIDAGELTIPIAATYPLEHVAKAYTRLAERHTRGKIVLRVAA